VARCCLDLDVAGERGAEAGMMTARGRIGISVESGGSRKGEMNAELDVNNTTANSEMAVHARTTQFDVSRREEFFPAAYNIV
jgi:hypothetical protein